VPHLHSAPGIALRLFVLAGLALCGTSAEAAETNSDQAPPPDVTKLSGARAVQPEPVKLEAVVVVGSRLPAAEGQTAQDIHIYDLERIEQSGQSSVGDFLATLPEVSLAAPQNATGATPVRLRGAIFGSALILINGRRVQAVTGGAATFGFFDVNTIPLSLVERIEVLPTGSSAIYGGDALAGVVNIILRSNFTGLEVGAGYQWAKNTDQPVVWAGGGWQAGNLSVTAMATYSDRTSLFGKDRDITANPDLRRFGGPNLGTPSFGVPANVSSLSGNLPGLNSSFAAVPVGSSGIGLKPSDFAATAGTQTTGSFSRYQSLIPDQRQTGAFLGATYSFGSALELFAELLATKYDFDQVSTPPFLQLAKVPATNPFNPFGTTVAVSGVVQGAESLARVDFDETFVRPVVGARGKVGSWNWEVSALTSRDRGSQVISGQANAAVLNAALASSDPQTALNPFVDGPMASPAVLAAIYSARQVTNFEAQTTVVDAFARGPLAQLPAGPLDALVGAEYEKNRFERGFTATQTDRAVFTELRAPLFASTNERGEKREVLAVQGAARYDDYSDFGAKTTWQVGVELRPIEDLVLRGTHATAFRPPTLYNLGAPLSTSTITVTDPMRNNESAVVQSITGGNASLQPTTGSSSTLGFVWSPRQLPGLDMSLTRWWNTIEDAINFPISSQFVVDNESAFPGRVIRAPAPPGQVGQIIATDRTYINFGKFNQAGFDGSIAWKFRTSVGELTPAVAATYMTKFEGSSTAGSPSIDRLSRASNDGVFAPRSKGIASITWKPNEAYDVWVDGRYLGRYTDYTPPHTLGNVWYLDASLEMNVERALGMSKGSLGGASLLVSGTNLTNKLPDWSTFFRGYDVFNYDLVGRTIFVRLKWRFGA
jgi:iron complex outermembrane receptor protein